MEILSKQQAAICLLLKCADCLEVRLTKKEIAQILYTIAHIKDIRKLEIELMLEQKRKEKVEITPKPEPGITRKYS
jgi:hypothetical protein